MTGPSVLNASTRALVGHCAARGVPPERLFPRSSPAPSDLDSPAGRLTVAAMAAAWEHAERATGDPRLGSRVAALVPFGAYGALDYATHASATAGEALALAARHFDMAHGAAQLNVERAAGKAAIELRCWSVPDAHQLRSAEYTFALLASRSRLATGIAWSPEEVRFAGPPPPPERALRTFLGARVSYGGEAHRMIVGRATLGFRHACADPGLRDHLVERLRTPHGRVPPRVELDQRCRRALTAALPAGTPLLPAVARALGMSERSLQRQLHRHGLSFRALRDEVRLDLASALLTERGPTTVTIAAELGFSEASAFHRAFRRWTGMTPRRFRGGAGLGPC